VTIEFAEEWARVFPSFGILEKRAHVSGTRRWKLLQRENAEFARSVKELIHSAGLPIPDSSFIMVELAQLEMMGRSISGRAVTQNN
jgi:hypothetical protein